MGSTSPIVHTLLAFLFLLMTTTITMMAEAAPVPNPLLPDRRIRHLQVLDMSSSGSVALNSTDLVIGSIGSSASATPRSRVNGFATPTPLVALAAAVRIASSSSSSTPLPNYPPPSVTSDSSSDWVTAVGAAAGTVVFVAIVALVIWQVRVRSQFGM